MEDSLIQILPVYSFPDSNKNTNIENGPRFSARPLKHWRKQLNSAIANRRALIGMSMDRPGESISINNAENYCISCKGALDMTYKLIKDAKCNSCIGKDRVNRTLIKQVTSLEENTFNDTSAYLEYRCLSYDQKNGTNPDPNIKYFTPDGIIILPSNSPDGTQNRKTNNCTYSQCERTIYKPNNLQYTQQGSVPSRNRISRLKYNTLNNNGAAFSSSYGAEKINSGIYIFEPSPSYYIKNKPQPPTCFRKNEVKSYC